MAEERSNSKSQSLLSGAFVLVIATVIVKVIGALFKIPLSMLIGEVGRGYFSTAYEIYTPLYSISMAGLPIAVSRLVAKERSIGHFRDVRMIRLVARRLFLLMGALGTIILLLIAYPYTKYIVGYVENIYCVLAIAPSIFFCCCMSTYRGYYEGMQNMVPTAVSEVIEVVGKLIVGLGASYAFIKSQLSKFNTGRPIFGEIRTSKEDALAVIYPYAAAVAVLGVTSGTILGLLYLIIRHRVIGDGITKSQLISSPKPISGNKLAKVIIMTALPIAASSLVTNITNLIDAATIQNRLKYAVEKAPEVIYALYGEEFAEMKIADSQIVKYIYGIYNEVLDFKNLVPTITMTLGISAIPVLSAAWANNQRHEIKLAVESVIRVTMLLSLPIGFGLTAVSYSLLDMFYPSATASIGMPILAVYGCTMFIFAVSSPITSMLQGLGRTDIPLKALTVGAVIKIVLNYVLIGDPNINIQGAPIASIVCYLVVTMINLYYIIKLTGVRINLVSVFIKPCICSAISASVAFLTNLVFGKFLGSFGDPDAVFNGNTVALLISVVAAVIAYIITILLFKGISKDDLLMIPKGEKLAETLEKHKFLG